MNPSLVADKTLWDSLGNFCKIEMHQIGKDEYEVYFHEFNNAIPKRFVGTLGICINKGDNWIASKNAAGFSLEHQLSAPSVD